MTNRFSIPALAAFALLLVACPKKGGGADAGSDAAPVTADTAPAVVDAGTTTAPTLATAPKPVVKHTDAGAADSGAAAATDAGAAPAGDGGATAQTCCCKVGDAYSNGVTQSSCAGTMKGACVKQEECEKRQCCCDAGGKKSTQMQAECTKTMKGKCVAKDQCK